jgi:hypothetical protein
MAAKGIPTGRKRPISSPKYSKTSSKVFNPHHRNEEGNLEYELNDIFEEYSEDSLADSIEYIMKREDLFGKDMSVVFPVGGYEQFLMPKKGEFGFYQIDFEVFSGADKMTYHGTAYGSFTPMEGDNGEIIDMTIELKEVK